MGVLSVPGKHSQSRSVHGLRIHEGFSPRTFNNDMALLRLASPWGSTSGPASSRAGGKCRLKVGVRMKWDPGPTHRCQEAPLVTHMFNDFCRAEPRFSLFRLQDSVVTSFILVVMNGLHFFVTRGHPKHFTVLRDIHPFMLTFTHRRRRQPCKTTTSSLEWAAG